MSFTAFPTGGLVFVLFFLWKSPGAVNGLVSPFPNALRVQAFFIGLGLCFDLAPVTECTSVSVLLTLSQLCTLSRTLSVGSVNTGLTGVLLALLGLSEDFCVMVLA